MRDLLLTWARQHDGVITRRRALELAPRHVLDDAVAAKALIRVAPRVFTTPESRYDDWALDVAAAAYVGPAGMLSHITSLRILGVPRLGVPAFPRHGTVGRSSKLDSAPGLVVVHRDVDFRPDSPRVALRWGVRLAPLDDALLASWSMLPDPLSVFVEAVQQRRTTAAASPRRWPHGRALPAPRRFAAC